MIVICEECGKQYRIVPGRIKGGQARFNCRSCFHRITINKDASVSVTFASSIDGQPLNDNSRDQPTASAGISLAQPQVNTEDASVPPIHAAQADKYPFLDPFAAEFKYLDQKLTFVGDTTDRERVQAAIESIGEIAREIDVHVAFSENFNAWAQKYEAKVDNLIITI